MSLMDDVCLIHRRDWRKNGPFTGFSSEESYVRNKIAGMTNYELLDAISDCLDERFEMLSSRVSGLAKKDSE